MHVMSHSLSFPFLASSFQFIKKTLKQNSSPELIFSVPLWFSLLGLLHVSFLSLCQQPGERFQGLGAWVNVVRSAGSRGCWLGQHWWQQLRICKASKGRLVWMYYRLWKRQVGGVEKNVFTCHAKKFKGRSQLLNYILSSSAIPWCPLVGCNKAVQVFLMFGMHACIQLQSQACLWKRKC